MYVHLCINNYQRENFHAHVNNKSRLNNSALHCELPLLNYNILEEVLWRARHGLRACPWTTLRAWGREGPWELVRAFEGTWRLYQGVRGKRGGVWGWMKECEKMWGLRGGVGVRKRAWMLCNNTWVRVRESEGRRRSWGDVQRREGRHRGGGWGLIEASGAVRRGWGEGEERHYERGKGTVLKSKLSKHLKHEKNTKYQLWRYC